MRRITYWPWTRWADAYQGRRDGLAEVPGRSLRLPAAGPATTPHREVLIRQARDAFGYEHLAYQAEAAGTHRDILAARVRKGHASDRLGWAQAELDEESRPLGPHEETRRRLGEERHPQTVILTRRRREQRRLVARAGRERASAAGELAEAEAELERLTEQARQQHKAAVTRVERIHDHVHRRLAVYRRALVRAHPEGAWVNAVLSPLTPEKPGWALPGAYLPDAVEPPPPPPPSADAGTAGEPPPTLANSEIITLRRPENRFGSRRRDDTDRIAFYQLTGGHVTAPWHFTIMREASRLLLVPQGYAHGPYRDGEQVSGTVALRAGDYFDFGDRRYTVQEDIAALHAARLGKSDLIAVDLWAISKSRGKAPDKTRLSDMSFVQRERTVLAVLGPSGAGKTSTFSALMGELRLQSGRMYFRGMPLASHARQIREQLGFVPQHLALHPTLTVEATLRYGFGLRSPAGKAAREAAVDRVIDAVDLRKQRGQLFDTLSGGQQRRVSIALELLTEPSLLMLDEPTSGLDASMDRKIMQILRDYAEHEDPGHPERSRTVVVITHATEHLHLAHQILVVVEDGAPAYSGPPRQIRKHFGCRTYADLMTELMSDPRKWAGKYQDGRQRAEAFREADQLEAAIAADPAGHARGLRRARRRRSPHARFQQFSVLIRRQVALLHSRGRKDDDHSLPAELWNWGKVALPFIVTALSSWLAAGVAASPGLGPGPGATTALTLLSTLGMLSGQALTYSDIVNEMPIVRREARAGVGAFPVLASKWLVFSVLAIGQAAVITAVFCAVPHRSPQRGLIVGPVPDLFLGLAALSITSMSLGLLISVLGAKLEHAVTLVTAVSIAQIALNGITSNLSRLTGVSAFAAIFPDRWGVAAVASSIDLRGLNGRLVSPDPLWTHSAACWMTDVGVLGALSAAYFTLACWLLARKLRLKG